MAFKGTLKEFKVPDILQLISMQRKTGILTFTSSDGFITLIFEDGMIVGVDAFPKKLELRVGNVLVKQDFISEDMLQRALDIQKRTNQKIGEVLVSMGLLDKETIDESLITQAFEIALSLFKWKKGEYNFKVMETLDDNMRVIDAMSADNLVMEGVQMLDEWPLIKKLVPDENMVFEAVPVEGKSIHIVGEHEDMPGSKKGKIFLSETEANLLKNVNGENTVHDLTELGLFTEYKVYKCLYNLVRKSIIRAKKSEDEARGDEIAEQIRKKAALKVDLLFKVAAALLLIIVALTFFTPMSPFKKENILFDNSFYRQVVSGVNIGSGGLAADKK